MVGVLNPVNEIPIWRHTSYMTGGDNKIHPNSISVELANAIIIVGLPIAPVFWWKGWKHQKKNIQRVTG